MTQFLVFRQYFLDGLKVWEAIAPPSPILLSSKPIIEHLPLSGINPQLWATLAIDLTALPLSHLSQYTAVQYFLTVQAHPSPQASPLAQVEPYLECFYHLTEVEDWRRAMLILTTIPDAQLGTELHTQLGHWGYWQAQKQLYETLLHRVNPASDSVCWNGLGNYYDAQGQYDRALAAHQAHLDLAQSLGDHQGQWMALTGLGNAHMGRGDWVEAEAAYGSALALLATLEPRPEYRKGEAIATGSLARIAYARQDYNQAQTYAQRCLRGGEALNQPLIVMKALHLLGDIATQTGNLTTALSFYQQSLDLAEQHREREQCCDTFQSLGMVYDALGEWETALEWHQKSLKLAQELGEPALIGAAFQGLGQAYYQLDCFEQARHQFQQCLEMAMQCQDQRTMLQAMRGLAYAEDALDRLEVALLWEERCLALALVLEDAENGAIASAYLGYAYLNLEQYDLAFQHLATALNWQFKHGEPSELAMTYFNLATTCYRLGQMEQAQEFLNLGFILAQQDAPHLLALYAQLCQDLCQDLLYSIPSVNPDLEP